MPYIEPDIRWLTPANKTDLEQLTSEFVVFEDKTDNKWADVDEALENMAARLSELEDSNKLLTSCAAFGSGFMAAKIAICIMMRVFGLNKKTKQLKIRGRVFCLNPRS